MAVTRSGNKTGRPALDEAALERAALGYAGRFGTTRARLHDHLCRKLRERGWAGPGEADMAVERLVERCAELGYVDDRAFAVARAASLGRRGYGARRVGQALNAAGVGDEDAAMVLERARDGAWAAALRFAERRRIGPFAAAVADRPAREKALAAMLRAGHSPAVARRIVAADPGSVPEPDE